MPSATSFEPGKPKASPARPCLAACDLLQQVCLLIFAAVLALFAVASAQAPVTTYQKMATIALPGGRLMDAMWQLTSITGRVFVPVAGKGMLVFTAS